MNRSSPAQTPASAIYYGEHNSKNLSFVYNVKHIGNPFMYLVSAFHCAAFEGRAESMDVLLNAIKGIGRVSLLKKMDASGYTPLHYAVARGHLSIVEMILASVATEAGIELIAVKSRRQDTVYDLAVQFENPEIIGILASHSRKAEKSQKNKKRKQSE